VKLCYPPFNPRTRNDSGQVRIFDQLRKKWLVLTPEEWVRQHVVNYLIIEKKFPAALISLEKKLVLNDLVKRYDVIVYDKHKAPYLVIECKAPFIEVDQAVLDQALRYNLVVKAPLLMITNGITEFVYVNGIRVSEVPEWNG
jgi:hypothetical protein